MSERIEVGDLVMVVRGHSCNLETYGGIVFTVLAIVSVSKNIWKCYNGHSVDIGRKFVVQVEESIGLPIDWVKKISPIPEPDSVENREELTA